MANTEWASVFFNKVTSTLPDLLTRHGEGKELDALDELRKTLGEEKAKENAARAKELQAELDRLNGKAPKEEPKEEKATPAEGSGGEASAKAGKR